MAALGLKSSKIGTRSDRNLELILGGYELLHANIIIRYMVVNKGRYIISAVII